MSTVVLSLVLAFSQLALGEVKLLKTLEQQIEPSITALLIIDMQNDYVADQGKVGKLGMDVKKIQEAVPTMNRLIEEARKAGVMVVWIRQTHSMRDGLMLIASVLVFLKFARELWKQRFRKA